MYIFAIIALAYVVLGVIILLHFVGELAIREDIPRNEKWFIGLVIFLVWPGAIYLRVTSHGNKRTRSRHDDPKARY